ncbi:leucyl aminopeptidase [Cenarchaeum symbiosum A]|uniref:Probable cytosol aminopeptidase n=1 Tax=Cenarchaeum symbiosum (strain A) TaxID=414004 RepID=AMPA_CENSY|nr:RecName: Full=Probable cytosol aminopeptidase; AltName: Full=Leucine aminopeptidase; Short=LAP; AltName: Full=Leucyl aminopeptidase [Cenarchaeum symbiosum A]ABK76922.1 leucyl aminopeptidase [Cenarchaeum symbiosum A]
MKITADASDPAKRKTAALCGFVLEGAAGAAGLGGPGLDDLIKEAIGKNGGKKGRISMTGTPGMPSERVILAGLGPAGKVTSDGIRSEAGRLARQVRDMGLADFAVAAPSILDPAEEAALIVEGAELALYSFDEFKAEKAGNSPRLHILGGGPSAARAIKDAQSITAGVAFARGLANMPPNECPPDKLGRAAVKMCTGKKMRCIVLKKPELKKGGFGGIIAVGQGSSNEPRLIIVEYNGGKKGQKPIVLVGKAVTFDTGGISIKPGEKMDEMKFDKCGGCTVLGIMKAVEDLALPVNVIGIVPSVENMPGGSSYRPGDIVKLYSGKTAEILNTDAEGRLILADALSYGEKKYAPSEIIDFATLTGACIVALGNNVAGMVSNDDAFAKRIEGASERTAEEVWRLPINDDYMSMIKSEVADMRNLGMGRAAGTITAAAFLKNAIGDTPWVHLDIAGTAWNQPATKKKPYNPGGATGFGVRLVAGYLKGRAQ